MRELFGTRTERSSVCRTPFHADVLTSYSWSANIVGRKRWLLFPPGEENRLRDAHGQLSFDATSEELNDRKKYPNYDATSLRRFEIIQETGEIIFVPSGWHHQVWNLVSFLGSEKMLSFSNCNVFSSDYRKNTIFNAGRKFAILEEKRNRD